MRLRDKVAVITGSGGALGSVAAKKFSNEGAKLVITDINQEGGEKTVSEIKKSGGEAVFVKADLAKVPECEKVIGTAVDTFGNIDILYNNAGFELMKSAHEYTEEDYDNIMDIHCKGSFFCIRYALPEMMKQKSGCIINQGSIAAMVGHIKSAAYCMAKGGLVNYTRYVALEYAPYNIRCNCICPGAAATVMMERFKIKYPELAQQSIGNHPMGRMAKPEEIADAAVFLSSNEASFITGVILPVDGGYLAGKS
jgi:NAD(P)-dependent dehydrogenase (short-subunit alcohol dehydrogenase family)